MLTPTRVYITLEGLRVIEMESACSEKSGSPHRMRASDFFIS